MKHTAEEWTMKDQGFGIQIEPSVAWIGFGTAHSKEEHKANALLIAAAPKLLKALRQLLLNTERTPFLSRSLDQARDAIEEATTNR